MTDSLLSTITEYAQRTFSPELQDELTGSLALFNAFDYQKPYEHIPDVLFDIDAENTDLTQSKFLGVFHDSLDALLSMHSIGIINPADLHVKNQILSAIYRIQHLEDPGPILVITESSFSNEEKFAKIIDANSILDEGTVLTSVDLIPDSFIAGLQQFLYSQEKRQEAEADSNAFTDELQIATLKDFFTCHGTDNLATDMLLSGVKQGYLLETYWQYVSEVIVTDDDIQTAKNMLSLFCLASDTYTNPLAAYHKHSEQLIHTTERAMRIEGVLADLLNTMRHYQKANDDAQRVSAVQHPA